MWELKSKRVRILLIALGISVLGMVYIFQRVSWTSWWPGPVHTHVEFVVNRVARLVLNDLACMLIMLAVFRERKYMVVGFMVFALELLVILPIYLVVKLSLEGSSEISSPLLSHIHRLIVNPMLMVLLMIGFFYQKVRARSA